MKNITAIICLLLMAFSASAQNNLKDRVFAMTDEIEADIIKWRRHLHQNPELSNREFKTAAYIAKYMKELGLEVHENIAHTGVVAVLKGKKDGPTVGLRADIDGLPVKERVDLPFKSTVETEYLGKKVGVMHACGHDSHIAMLMGAAKVLTDIQDNLKGNVVFIFQPAEEGAPPGEEGGAELMIQEGLIDKFGIDVVFGQHISSIVPEGMIMYKPEGIMAAADRFVIKIKGKQAHGSRPWSGVDPITISAQVILGLQNIVSRQVDLTAAPAVISVGKLESGVRNNIIPEEATLIGTIRTFDTEMQKDIHRRIKHTAEKIAESAGGSAEVDIQVGYPVTYNDPALTQRMLPTLYKGAGAEQMVRVIKPVTGAEDFSFYAREVPGLFYFLGALPTGTMAYENGAHHTPDFYISEKSFKTGTRTLCLLTLDYMLKN